MNNYVAPPPSAGANSLATRVGQLFFSIMSHFLYDLGLYRFISPYIWRCSTKRLLDNYVENVSRNHLEIGVGSGYFLERTLCADFLERLVLLDINRRCLKKSAHRLQEFAPVSYQHNILLPMPADLKKHSSVGMNYVLHCIPGDFLTMFFGATLLNHPVRCGFWPWLMMRLLNGVGIFNNQDHRLAELKEALEATFHDVEISVIGSAAVFRAVK